jgi:hypothetical protein
VGIKQGSPSQKPEAGDQSGGKEICLRLLRNDGDVKRPAYDFGSALIRKNRKTGMKFSSIPVFII